MSLSVRPPLLEALADIPERGPALSTRILRRLFCATENFNQMRCEALVKQLVVLTLGFQLLQPSNLAAGEFPGVTFDAPAIAVAEPVNPAVVELPTMGGELVRLRFAVSSRTAPQFRGRVSELIAEIENSQHTMRVVDYWPKIEVYSEIDGTIAVERQQHKDDNFKFNVSGAYEPFARGQVHGDFHTRQSVDERFAKKPPLQLVTSSGTMGRGYGVFYKFRSGPLPVADSGYEVALLVEVPSGWRADMLHVTLRAVGVGSSSTLTTRPEELGSARLWMAVHRADDQVAARHAQRYVAQEQSLRALAAQKQKQIDSRSFPTVFHRVGAALDVIDPRIPSDYLARVLFGPAESYFNEATNRLPVDLRVAILDYWDQRQTLMSLSRAAQPTVRASDQPAYASTSKRISDLK